MLVGGGFGRTRNREGLGEGRTRGCGSGEGTSERGIEAPELRQVVGWMGNRGFTDGLLRGEAHAPVPSLPRRKHVAALLDIRGLHNTAARQEILAVARDLELSEGGALPPPRDRAFFSDISVPRPPFCLGLPPFPGRLPLGRLARPGLACLPRLRPPSPSRPPSQR